MPFDLPYHRSFVATATNHPARLFWIFALAHLVLWTVIPTLSSPNAPLDVIEGYAWGREWPLGTYKHPPMQAWWLQILAVLTDRAAWAHFLASQIAILGAFWAVWQTGRRMVSETAALIGVLLLEGVIYYNFTSTEFNPNVLQLPFWALTGLSFHRAVKDNRLAEWFWLGVWSAAGLYSKYSTALLLAALLFLMFTQPAARRRLAGAGPYVALLVASLLFLPHLIWLVNHDFLPFRYALNQLQPSVQPHMLPRSVFAPLVLVLGQMFALIPFVLLFLVFYGRNGTSNADRTDAFDRAFLNAVTFGPFALTFLISAVLGFKVHDMWGMPFWSFLGLWVIVRFHPSLSQESLKRFAYAWSVVLVGALALYMGANIVYPYVEGRTARIHFPGRALAEHMASAWHERYHAPLRFVAGDTWAAGNVGYYARERPHVFIMGDKTISPWIKSLDFERYGGVVVWCVRHCLNQQENADAPPPFLRERFPQAQIQEPFFLARETEADVPPVKMGWAIIPPEAAAVP